MDLEKYLFAAGGGGISAIATAIAAYIKGRRFRKNTVTLEESVRKELWTEISNLRVALREASATLIEWQSKFFELSTSHTRLAEQLVDCQKNFATMGKLLQNALTALERVEAVERNIGDDKDLVRAKDELMHMRIAAEHIKHKASILYQS